MDIETLKALGITKEEIIEKTADKLCYSILDGESDLGDRFTDDVNRIVKESALAQVREAAAVSLIPRVGAAIEDISIQKTNSYGEPKGDPMTFQEFLLKSAESYMREEVDRDGNPKPEDPYRSWGCVGTRLSYLINKFLGEQLVKAVGEPTLLAISNVRQAIEDTTKKKMAELASELKVIVKTKK